jgi:oligopeptide transport system permease protein
MLSFLLRRLLWFGPVLMTVAIVTFFLMHRAPGGPWDSDKPVSSSTLENLNRRFGLDKPTWINPNAVADDWAEGERNPLALSRDLVDSQFGNYVLDAARFDLGPTYRSRGAESVQEVIRERLPTSAKVGIVGLVFAIGVGVPLGILSALRQNSWLDVLSLFVATGGIAVPTFVSGILLLIFFSQGFGVSPIRRPEEWRGFGLAYLLPGIILGLGTMAYLARLTRSTMLEVKRQDFVRTARAKGLGETAVVGRHMLRNALIPIVTVLGPAAADLLTGSFIIETIFGVPGLGREFVVSISRRDYSMIMGTTLFYALLIALANVTVDLSYGFIDPRVRRSK